jgi:trk system potassium uptake protein TrkH
MNFTQVVNYLGWFILYYSFAFLILLLPALIYKEYELIPAIFETFFCTLLFGSVGIILTYKKNPEEEENFLVRESLAFVGLGWIALTLLGSLPYSLSGYLPFVDAVFESVSGYTTTGATVVHDIEAFPKTLLFWRAFTHFLGGVGIVVIFVSILPYIGAGGRLLLESESFAPDIRSVKPRIKESVKQILLVYLSFNAANIILLMIFGMNFFDAVCHAFATLATGGFSTKQMSIGAYNSLPIEIITIFLCSAEQPILDFFTKSIMEILKYLLKM